MEVKEASAKYSRTTSYKQTEVGVIPEDWGIGRLGDHSEITKLAGFEYSTHFNSYKDGGEVIVIRGTNITHNSLDLSDVKTIPKSTSDKLPRSKLKEGDLVFAYVGTIGPVFLIDKDNRYHLGPNTARITCKDGLFPRFLFCYFLSDLIRKEITERISTGAQPSLSMAKIRAFRILIPTKAEQKAIAEVLSDADALIESLEQLLAKKRHLKQGAMQQLLTGKKRLPGFSGEWEVKRLGSVLKFQVGFPFSSTFFNEAGQGVRLVKNRDLKSDDQVFHYSGKYDQEFSVHDGDVLVGMDGDFLPCMWAKGPALLNQRVGRIVPLAGLDRVFAFYYLIEPLKEIENATSSTTVKHLSHGDIESIEKPLPGVQEQTAIATILSDMDAELAALEEKLTKARAIKQGMMQELLTGRIRLV